MCVAPDRCPGSHLDVWPPTASAWRRAPPRCPPWRGPGPPSSSPPSAARGTVCRTHPGHTGRPAARHCEPTTPCSVSTLSNAVFYCYCVGSLRTLRWRRRRAIIICVVSGARWPDSRPGNNTGTWADRGRGIVVRFTSLAGHLISCPMSRVTWRDICPCHVTHFLDILFLYFKEEQHILEYNLLTGRVIHSN